MLGTILMLETMDLFSLQLSSPSCLDIRFCPASHHLATSDNQFGFKPKHSTDVHIFLLKQNASYYESKDTPMFPAFLNAFKYFTELTTTSYFLNYSNQAQCTYVHSKTLVEVVQAPDHGSKMGHQLFMFPHCDQWGKGRGSAEPTRICCLPEWTLRLAGVSQGRMQCGKYGWESSNVCWWYVCVQPQF